MPCISRVIESLQTRLKHVAPPSSILLARTRLQFLTDPLRRRMIGSIPRLPWRAICAVCVFLLFLPSLTKAKAFQERAPFAAQSSTEQSREEGPQLRIPRQQARNTAALDGIVRDAASLTSGPIPGAALTLRNLQ